MKPSLIAGIATVACCVVSCGPSGSSEASKTTAAESRAPPTPSPANPIPIPASTSRDISALKACEIVPPQDVISIVGGKLLNEPPAGFPNCVYVLEVEGNTESYRLVFAEPQLYTAMLDSQGDVEKGERLAGLWDESYLQPRASGAGFSLIAVRRGDIALEVSGDRREPVIAIAKLAASRVD
jgi:hypothetical protein